MTTARWKLSHVRLLIRLRSERLVRIKPTISTKRFLRLRKKLAAMKRREAELRRQVHGAK